MDINFNEIELYLKNFNPEHFTEEDVDNFICGMSKDVPDFNWEYGATKCVIIPENRDYVIKIPFDGELDFNDEFEEEERDDGYFRYFYEGGGEDGWDYCQLEQEYFYEYLEESEFRDFFLVPETVNVKKDWPVYIQEKAIPYQEASGPVYKSTDSLYEVRTSGISSYTRIPDLWLAVCLENLNNDIEKLREFLNFLQDNFSDLHEGNIGYRNGHAIVLDYGGFSH